MPSLMLLLLGLATLAFGNILQCERERYESLRTASSASKRPIELCECSWLESMGITYPKTRFSRKTGLCHLPTSLNTKIRAMSQVKLISDLLPRDLTVWTSFNDPLFPDSWHLQGIGPPPVNVEAAWSAGFNGNGTTVAILDDSVDINHPDLANNIDRNLSWDYLDGDTDTTPKSSSQFHGTSVAGVAAAVANNGECGVGVSYSSKIAGRNVVFASARISDIWSALTDDVEDITVLNNSWGFVVCDTTMSCQMMEDISNIASGIKEATSEGRGGLGAPVCFAAGNEGEYQSDTNLSPLTRDPNVFTIGAVASTGVAPTYSTRGSSVFLCAPSLGDSGSGGSTQGIVAPVTSVSSTGSLTRGCTDSFSGTSAATPIVSGAIAVLDSAVPNIPLHEMRRILVLTARRTDQTGSGSAWTQSAHGTWHSRVYGFGVVDTYGSIRAAQTWVAAGDVSDVTVSCNSGDCRGSASGSTNFTFTMEVESSKDLVVESASISLGFSTSSLRNAQFWLRSPAGTRSLVLDAKRHPAGEASTDVGKASLLTWGFWGEYAAGNWTVEVIAGDATINVRGARLVVRGVPTGLHAAPILTNGTQCVARWHTGNPTIRAEYFPDGTTVDLYAIAGQKVNATMTKVASANVSDGTVSFTSTAGGCPTQVAIVPSDVSPTPYGRRNNAISGIPELSAPLPGDDDVPSDGIAGVASWSGIAGAAIVGAIAAALV